LPIPMIPTQGTQGPLIFAQVTPLPDYNGRDDVITWLKLYELAASGNRWSDDIKLAKVIYSLPTEARIWYLSKMDEGKTTTWDDAKFQLTEHFRSSYNTMASEELIYNMKQSPNESIDEYYHRKVGLMMQIDHEMSEKDKIHHVLRGLGPKIRKTMLKKSFEETPTTLDGCHHMLRLLEDTNRYINEHIRPKEKPKRVTHSNFLADVTKETRYTQDREPRNKEAYKKLQSAVANDPASEMIPMRTLNVRGRCYSCGEYGHYAQHCSNHEEVGYKCYTCKQIGHFARDCPNSKFNKCFTCKEPGHLARNCPNQQVAESKDDGDEEPQQSMDESG
jgi:Retrotransposon gag protein/Zinc knuckle